MNNEEFIAKIPLFMATQRKNMQKLLKTALTPYGLNSFHAFFLKELVAGEKTLKELTVNLEVNRASSTRAVSTLKAGGFVSDDKKNESKRKYRIFITEKGREVAALIEAQFLIYRTELFSKLSDLQQSQLGEIMSKLLE